MTDETLFHLALKKPPPERAGFLERTCAGDSALLSTHEPDRLVASHAKLAGILLS